MKRKTLLLHVCCAPCMSAGIEALAAEYDMTAYFYDPNIVVRSEYYRRLGEVKRLIAALGLDIPVIDGGYDPAAYRAAVGNEFGGAEGGRKCTLCINSRLAAAVKKCAELGLGYCTTTLTASPLKNAAAINAAGTELAEKAGVCWLQSDFKKKGGCVRIKDLCTRFGIYRQHYCGCTPDKLKIAVTGGIASGKSRFVGMLSDLGAYTIDADEVTRELQTPGHKVYDDILSVFPHCAPDGRLDRKLLAAEVFSDAAKRRRLEELVHPAVQAEMTRRAEERSARITVFEVPLLFESGMADMADIVVTVSAPYALRLDRAAARNGMTEEMFRGVCSAQWTDAMREEKSDVVVVNDGDEASLGRQAKELYEEWMRITQKA